MKVYWTKEAVVRLNEIKLFIMKDNPIAAEKLIDKLITLAESLSKNPERGRIVPEFSIKVIRELLYKNYRIVYLLKKRRIEILTVFEGHRLIHKEEINNIKIS
ncbi:MAG: type II toxin-antitoxin system RelE/ParE family toxin [Ignavibacterium sp.]|jgi:plasmid stabilization system protein ParE|uniref:type II toxin-antitoxin system RelE/ParE family toxin n=1 Tax=Ignavibacterium sp. TaxID=2651167 RepID=UPI0032988FBF